MTTTWKCLNSSLVEDVNNNSIIFPNFDKAFRIQLQKKLSGFDELNEVE